MSLPIMLEISTELLKAMTMTEIRYGQGVSDVRVSLVQYATQFVGNPYVWGGTKSDQRCGLLRFCHERICQLRHFPSAFFRRAVELRNEDFGL